MAFPPPPLVELVEQVLKCLIRAGSTLSVAETAAGGLISASLLSFPGSSKFYRGGLTLYSLESRIAFAGWTQKDIDQYRGPSEEIVAGPAKNVCLKLNSTYGICESGTAGPTGGSTPNRQPSGVSQIQPEFR